MSENPLRQVPKMDLLLSHPILERADLPRSALRQAARSCLDGLRASLKARPGQVVPSMEELARRTAELAALAARPHLRRVVNATGVVLHTNLGRAPLAEAAAQAAYEAARGYSNLEYDVESGRRGDRHAHVEDLLCKLTGAEAAIAVNNNAAAVLLMLSALAAGKGVAVSRGELVEIGGGFRVPDVMARSGAELIEVGTTNKTRLSDYERSVIRQGAGALLKVHPSNYEIVGFTEETSLSDLFHLKQRYSIPLLYDLGSGALTKAYLPFLPDGPTVSEALAAGCDAVCFSGDKLLGGPQAGIAVGKKVCIDAMKKDPLARALRIDKLSLAALEATLLLCADPAEGRVRVPTLAMLSASSEQLKVRAGELAGRLAALSNRRFTVEVLPTEGQVGGGAIPNRALPSFAAALTPGDGDLSQLEGLLRNWSTPIVARVSHGKLLLDVRTLTAEDVDEIVEALANG
ncbi:selenocysteine synthase [uncultured Eubacteriales bacterium]|uniref:L-seryl-tRNA(Sec) selenium transferase n=1 Tax=uncultured Eubacteriales bacterium TaxID=172733 RepID=A0A212KAU7_9FIRM|nr:selenocysteine synthase [uncultured Eubacteriales bacterium]